MLFNVPAAEDVRCAVVGHVEVVEFAPVDQVPQPGEIVQAGETWTEPAGGGAVAARELLRLAGNVTFFTAFGDDELGHAAEEELRAAGIRVECAYRDEPQRRGFTYVDANGERTITVIGRKLVPRAHDPLPWDELDDVAGVYFCGGDPGAVREARRAKALVATARELPTLEGAGVELDALVQSASDRAERYRPGDLDPAPRLVVTTEGREGGHYLEGEREGTWEAAPLPGPLADTYGAGDTFAAALAFALGQARPAQAALEFAAERAALAMTRRGAAIDEVGNSGLKWGEVGDP
jgi:ribokinase